MRISLVSSAAIFLFFTSNAAAAGPRRAQQVAEAPKRLPSSQSITPTAAPGSKLEILKPGTAAHPDRPAGDAVTSALSPDGKTLLVLTSGYNQWYNAEGRVDRAASSEWVFVFDISGISPRQVQAVPVPNAFGGIVWSPTGAEFYVAGGVDDSVHTFAQKNGRWTESDTPIALGHKTGLGINIKPMAAGIATTANGARLVVANFENDSISVIDRDSRGVSSELDLRPGKIDAAQRGRPGGEFPYWVCMRGDSRAYISSVRDREIVVVELGAKPSVIARVPVKGEPNKMVLNRAQTRLYVAEDNNDSLAEIDTANNQLLGEMNVTAPGEVVAQLGGFGGSSPNDVALSPDEHTAYVSLGGANAVSAVHLGAEGRPSEVAGLIPTGWYPTDITVSRNGSTIYVTNGKSIPEGPNLGGCRNSTSSERDALDHCHAQNQYTLQLVRAGLLTIPTPNASQLAALTARVGENNRWGEISASNSSAELMKDIRGKIHHAIYIVKENRSYDEVFGDLEKGNGDPSLTILPERLSPNHHALARKFVTLDNIFASGEVSGDGWNWSTTARATDALEKTIRVNYATRGLSYDFEGSNRWINVGVENGEARRQSDPLLPEDPDLLPGTADYISPDGPKGERGQGYLWDAALRAGLTIRNYGWFVDTTRADARPGSKGYIKLVRDPFAQHVEVAFPANPALVGRTDTYYPGFSLKLPDYWRFKEWEREFDAYVAGNNLPSLETIRLPNDHFGDFANGTDGVNTVETQMGDNDYALGLIVEKVSKSPYAKDTVIFVIEDDAQNGPDHVDAHRTVAFVMGAYVKQGALVSTAYSTVNMIRTIEEVLGMGRMGLNDAAAAPMADCFTAEYKAWDYTPRVPVMLRSTQLPLPPAQTGSADSAENIHSRHTPVWWAAHSRGQDFSVEDDLDTNRFNRALWLGLAPSNAPFPSHPVTGADLRENRAALLAKYGF